MNIVKKLVVFILFVVGISWVSPVSAAPPVNFQTTQIVGSGLEGPSGFEIAPDGRIFILERTGLIKIVKDGVLLPTPFADLPSAASGDRGLIGIAFDPQFAQNAYVYFYYTGTDLMNRLVRFNASGDVGTDGPFLIYQTFSPSYELHVGGSIQFGLDGKMYFAVGDNGYPPNAQNLSNPHGKIMRINKDGSIPLDNPFVMTEGALPEIWAYGFRNPWRFQFDSLDGRLYGADVGDFSIEEMNHIIKGGNYGWPLFEGFCGGCAYNDPIYAYPHNGQSSAITGGPVYRGSMFPPEYQGDLFIADYAKGFIRNLDLEVHPDGQVHVHSAADFDPNAGSVVDMKVAPDGSFYYITYYPGRLYRITYSTGNQIPVVSATADVTKGIEPLTVHFSSAGTYDPDNDPLSYLWNFGDGSTSIDPNPTKIFTEKGSYTVDLQVTDIDTNTGSSVPLVIQVGLPPVVTIGAPEDNAQYNAGDTIFYTASAVDGAGFDLHDSSFTTEVVFHHDTHTHPFLGPVIGKTGQFVVPTTGEPDPDTYFEIKITATDTNGLSTTEAVNIYPRHSTFTLQSAISGLKLLLDGVPVDSPHFITGVIGFMREISAPLVQKLGDVWYQLDSWSDGGILKHFIAVAETDKTYTAYFREVPPFVGEYFNNTTLAGAPTLTRQDPVIDFTWNDNSPDPLITSDGFSVRWTKEQYFAFGKYRFTSVTDDGVRLFIDGQLVIDKWIGQGSTAYNAILTLNEGNHSVVMEYFEGNGGAVAKLNWELTTDQPTAPIQTGFNGQYFSNMTLSGAPTLTRNDAEVNFLWNDENPDPSLPFDAFSVRWTKTQDFAAGSYRFSVTADDGIRLFVDDELIIDKWIDQGMTTYTADKTLNAGNHVLRIEYYEHSGGAIAQFSFAPVAGASPTPSPATENWNARFWNTPGYGEFPPLPTTPPDVTRTDTVINFQWDAGMSPDPLIAADHFVGIWEKTHYFPTSSQYKFTTESDDGMNVYVDGVKVLDEWNDHSMQFVFHHFVTAGNHEIRVEYYENDGGAKAVFDFEPVASAPPVYNTEFFNNIDLTGAPVVTRQDEILYFVWAEGTPDPLVNVNNFSARWTKTDTFAPGVYEFTVFADDAMRLFVDGVLEVDAWTGSAEIYHYKNINLSGEHTLTVEYAELTGGAYAKMYYKKVADLPETSPSPSPSVTPSPSPSVPPTGDYLSEFWNLPVPVAIPTIPTTNPTLTRNDATVDFTWNDAAPAPEINFDGYVARFSKSQEITEAGTYTFTTQSDDGIRVKVDGDLIIDQWNDHGLTTHTGEKFLTLGTHEIIVEFYENSGGAIAKMSFALTGTLPPSGFTGDYFANMTLSGAPALTREDATINFVWDDASPDVLLPVDGFSVRWTKPKFFLDGLYSFTLKSDDGIRFYVDDTLIYENWTDHAMAIETVSVPLTTGTHTLKIEYYENTGGAVAIFEEN